MNKIKKWIASVFMISIMAFLTNGMIPFFASYNQDAVFYPAEEKILICHGDGFIVGTKQDIPTSEQTDYHCPSCYIIVHGAKSLSVAVNIPAFYQAFLEKLYIPLRQPFFISGVFSHDYINSHAPPPFIFFSL